MSGGSYDYFYIKLEDVASQIRDADICPRRMTLRRILLLIAKAMHAVEWVDSCDWGPEREKEALDALFICLGSSPEQIVKANAYDSLKERLKDILTGMEK